MKDCARLRKRVDLSWAWEMGRILPGGRERGEIQEGRPDKRGKAVSIGELSVLMELGLLLKERQKLLSEEIKL